MPELEQRIFKVSDDFPALLLDMMSDDGIGVDELSNIVHESNIRMWRIVRGKEKPSISLVCQLAKIFDVDISYFLTKDTDDIEYRYIQNKIEELSKIIDDLRHDISINEVCDNYGIEEVDLIDTLNLFQEIPIEITDPELKQKICFLHIDLSEGN